MYCCEEVERSFKEHGRWMGGSHYHCGNCGEVSSMMGCYHTVHRIDGEWVRVEGHFGCSDKCDQKK